MTRDLCMAYDILFRSQANVTAFHIGFEVSTKGKLGVFFDYQLSSFINLKVFYP